MKKILMLHGYTQNAKIFSAKLGAIRKMCPSDIEMVFVDGPIIVPMPTENENNRAALDSTSSNIADDPDMTPRAWWIADALNDGSRHYRGCEESLRYLSQLLQKDTYFGVFGFSQGAAMAALLTALLEKPSTHSAFANISPALPTFHWSVFVAGFRSVDPSHTPVFATPIQGKTLHVLGRTDTIVSQDRTQTLVDACAKPRIEYHDGGHHVPSKGPWRNFFKAYIESDGSDEAGSPSRSATPGADDQAVKSFGRL